MTEENFLEEVKRDLAEEKKMRAVRKVLPFAISIFILALIATISYVWWSNYNHNIAHQDGAKYLMAEVKKRYYDIPDMMKIFEEMANESSTYGALSQIFLASEAMLRGENNRAQTYLEKTSEGYKGPINEIGKLEYLTIKLDQPGVDLKEVISQLSVLYEDSSIVSENAKELLILALKKNKDERYKKLLDEVMNSNEATDSVKMRLAGYYY